MNKQLHFLTIFIASCLVCFSAMIRSAQMVGNYRPVSVTDTQVANTAKFAVEAQSQNETSTKLKSIEKAERQIVAGTNYRLCLTVESNGEVKKATAVVYQNLQNKYELTSWTNDNCAGNAETALQNADEGAKSTEDSFKGKLEVGKTNSTILYVGEESGDYAAFCFLNNSEVGRKILAVCKNGGQCEFTGKVDYEGACKVPGLEASLSASGKILSVTKVKSFAKKTAPSRKSSSLNASPVPDAVIRNLYATHNAKKSPFFQTKERVLVDKYFSKDFADLIWKDAVAADGEVGALGADPLYNAQDTRITLFKIGKPEYGEGNIDLADVPVTFKNFGKPETILFRLEKGGDKKWKITNIFYPSNEEKSSSLKDLLTR